MPDKESTKENASPMKGRFSLPELCPHCPKMLSRRDKLVNHIKTQHPGKPIPLASSTVAAVGFTETKETFLKHLPIPCPFCDKILSRRDKLNKHIKNIHLKQSVDNDYRNEPLLTSGKENASSESPIEKRKEPKPTSPKKKAQPPPCPYCNAVLSRMDKLNKHIQKKHPGKHLKSEKCKKQKKNEKVGTKEKKKNNEVPFQTPWDLLWNSKEPVFVKFDFKKKLLKRQRTDSEVTVDFDFEELVGSRLVRPPQSPPRKKIQILEAVKYK